MASSGDVENWTSCDGEAARFEYIFEGHLQRIQENLHAQWLQGTFCDLELKTCDGSIRAHTCLLATFSPKIAAAYFLHNSGSNLNVNKLSNLISLDIMFNYDIVKTIVEAIYSGFLTAPLENLDELEAALKWLEMHELVEVVKYIHDHAKKEDLITTPDIKLPEADSIKVGQCKSVRKPRKLKSLLGPMEASPNPDSFNVVVSKVNDVPVVVLLNQQDSEYLPGEFRTIKDSMVLGESHEREQSMNSLSPKNALVELPDHSRKENLIIAPDINLPEADSIKVGQCKSVRKRRKSKSLLEPIEASSNPDSVNVVVSMVNDVPVVLLLNQKDGESVQSEFRTIKDSMVPGEDDEREQSMNSLSKKNALVELADIDIDNDLTENEIINEHNQSDSHENLPDIFLHADDVDDAHVFNSRSEMGIMKSAKEVKTKHTSERSPLSLTKNKRIKDESTGEVRSEGRDKSYVENTSSGEALRNQSPNIIEEGDIKKTQATEALVCIGSNLVKEEPPDDEEFEPFDEEEEAFVNGQSDHIKCVKCKSTFFNVDEYKIHIKKHPTFTCENCFIVFYSRSLFTRHIRGSHLKSMHLKCTYCDFTSSDDKLFEQHSIEVHNEVRPFKCLFEDCKFTTKKYRYLTNHFQKHEDFRSHACEKCHKQFSNLYNHKRSCYQLQKYLCDICGQSFNILESMKIHRHTIHFGQKPYKCKECDKCFTHRANLQRHMRIHNNSYPYLCNICAKQFRHSNTFKLHMSKHKDTENPNPELEAVLPPKP